MMKISKFLINKKSNIGNEYLNNYDKINLIFTYTFYYFIKIFNFVHF